MNKEKEPVKKLQPVTYYGKKAYRLNPLIARQRVIALQNLNYADEELQAHERAPVTMANEGK